MKKLLLFILAAVCFAVALFSGYRLWRHVAEEQEIKEQFIGLSEQIRRPPTLAPGKSETTRTEWTVYDQYGELFEQNTDMIGWIAIDGTTLSYPVMHTPDRPNFYLKRDFEKNHSNFGVPYIAESSSINPQSDNLIIYGHHMRNGGMFGLLEQYKSEEFYRDHSIIRFDTRAGFGSYEIFAVFKVNPADFQYHMFIDAADQAEFDEYVFRCKAFSFYDTGITAQYGDKLITLSTCEYSRDNNRFIVVARKIVERGSP